MKTVDIVFTDSKKKKITIRLTRKEISELNRLSFMQISDEKVSHWIEKLRKWNHKRYNVISEEREERA